MRFFSQKTTDVLNWCQREIRWEPIRFLRVIAAASHISLHSPSCSQVDSITARQRGWSSYRIFYRRPRVIPWGHMPENNICPVSLQNCPRPTVGNSVSTPPPFGTFSLSVGWPGESGNTNPCKMTGVTLHSHDRYTER